MQRKPPVSNQDSRVDTLVDERCHDARFLFAISSLSLAFIRVPALISKIMLLSGTCGLAHLEVVAL